MNPFFHSFIEQIIVDSIFVGDAVKGWVDGNSAGRETGGRETKRLMKLSRYEKMRGSIGVWG